ncbi:MAG: hypothetical protein GH142_00060, partial [Dehalococcoidia bacterium]|nr:hypothetical protein [Dehalococcoidia bacterium]
MSALRLKLISIIFLIALSLSCEKNIYEAGEAGGFWSNDLLHGDLIGTVKQQDSSAEVID